MATRPATWRRPWLYPQQEAALYCAERIGIVEASTKSGKTMGALVWLLEQALLGGQPGRNYWWVAPIYPQARIAFERAKRGLAASAYTANDSNACLRLANGAVVWFKGAEESDSLYGEDVFAAVMDEYTRCKLASWVALRTTLTATRGPVRLIGNVKGRHNWGYKLARQAEAGSPGLHYARLTADDAVTAGVLDATEIADARAVLPEAEWRQLYYAEAAADEGNPFGPLAAVVRSAPSGLPPAVWGWDFARSVDWTVGVALDEVGNMCAPLERWQQGSEPPGGRGYWDATYGRIAQVTGNCPALVDSTGAGDPHLEALQRGAEDAVPPRRPITAEGYVFTQKSKQRLMEGLAAAIQSLEITVVAGPVVVELEQFEYRYTRSGAIYAAPEGVHDDCVVALALAVALYKRRPMAWREVAAVGPGSREPTVQERDAADDAAAVGYLRDVPRTHGSFSTSGW